MQELCLEIMFVSLAGNIEVNMLVLFVSSPNPQIRSSPHRARTELKEVPQVNPPVIKIKNIFKNQNYSKSL